jgi:transcription elongation factor Elf1
MDVTVVKEKLASAKRLRKQAKKKLRRAERKELEAQNSCPHTDTKRKDIYFSGSYLDKAKTITYLTCALCGKSMGSSVETHSWFG